MFVSEYFLIFIRYIFQLNWNLSRRIGREWHHSGSWAVPPRLMGCNKERGSEDGEGRGRRRGRSGGAGGGEKWIAGRRMKCNSESMGVKNTLRRMWLE